VKQGGKDPLMEARLSVMNLGLIEILNGWILGKNMLPMNTFILYP
jgi:hypothetical protein